MSATTRDLAVDPEGRVPSGFFGAWRRRALRVEGVPVVDDTEVLWLQVGQHFADLRIKGEPPVVPEMAAWGRTTWDGTALQWHAARSWGIPDEVADIGEVTWDGEVLIERGSVALGEHEVSYEERWVREVTRGPGTVLGVDEADVAGRVVICDGLALALVDRRAGGGSFAGHCLRRDADGWRCDFGTSATPEVVPPEQLPHDRGATVLLADTSWRVLDTW